jgi:predicted ArsR family transcriptional regulator
MKKSRQLPDSRRAVLQHLKREGAATAGELAERLGTTREGARQWLRVLEKEGAIARTAPRETGDAGRPAVSFALTPEGEHLFAKNYDNLAVSLVDAVADQLGQEALVKLLASITEQQVKEWEPKLAGKSLPERIKALKGIYFEEDPHTSVRKDARGYVLIERNCPYLNVAMRRPHLCSVTVSTLTRLLGVRVVREARFQDGDRRCVFRVLEDQPVDLSRYSFALETSEPRLAV